MQAGDGEESEQQEGEGRAGRSFPIPLIQRGAGRYTWWEPQSLRLTLLQLPPGPPSETADVRHLMAAAS